MLRKAQKQTIADLEEVTKLADVLYDLPAYGFCD
jgi:hypothetical protein